MLKKRSLFGIIGGAMSEHSDQENTSSRSSIKTFAEDRTHQDIQLLAFVLPHYEETVRDDIVQQQQSVLQIADQLDRALRDLINRCATATYAKSLAREIRQLRMRRLQFFGFLRTSRRLLRLASRRIAAQARIDGLDGSRAF
jgi:hypothetical protein